MVLVNTKYFSSFIMKLKIGNHKSPCYDSEHSCSVLLHNIANVLPYLKSSSIALCQYDGQSGLFTDSYQKEKTQTPIWQRIEKY